ncbi:hypothetical protein Btru_063443, partial [Bulinus truncatus]
MSEDNGAKPLRQPRFKITSRQAPSQSLPKAHGGPAEVPEIPAARTGDKESKTTQSALFPNNVQHKRIRSESRSRLPDHQEDACRGRSQANMCISGGARAERFAHRRSRSSMDGFYSQNNAERVIQRDFGFTKGSILDAVLQHGFDKTVNFGNVHKKLEDSIMNIAHEGNELYDYSKVVDNENFDVTNVKHIRNIKVADGEERKPIPLNRHRSPSQPLPFFGGETDLSKSRTMSEPPRSRLRELDLRPRGVLECNFVENREAEGRLGNTKLKKKRKHKHKRGSVHNFLASPKAPSQSGGSKHSLIHDLSNTKLPERQPTPFRSPPNSYRIHAKNTSGSKENLASKNHKEQNEESEGNAISTSKKSHKKSFRKWQPSNLSPDESHELQNVASDKKISDSSPPDKNKFQCSPRETGSNRSSPREKKTKEKSPSSPAREGKKVPTSHRHSSCEAVADNNATKESGSKSNILCETATKRELCKTAEEQQTDLSMSTANRKTSPAGQEKGKQKKKKESPKGTGACIPGYRFRKRCLRRPSLNRQNFFGNLAQAVGKELNTIAYRNSLFHSFPGMVGLYRPDIGMDSLFVNPSSIEPSEIEEEIDGLERDQKPFRSRKRRDDDDDDTSKQVSSSERLDSEKEMPKGKGKGRKTSGSTKKTGSKVASSTGKQSSTFTKERAVERHHSPLKTPDTKSVTEYDLSLSESVPPTPKERKLESRSHSTRQKSSDTFKSPPQDSRTSPKAMSRRQSVYDTGAVSSAESLTIQPDIPAVKKADTPTVPTPVKRLTNDVYSIQSSDGFESSIHPDLQTAELSEKLEDSLFTSTRMSQIIPSKSDSKRLSARPSTGYEAAPSLSVDSQRQSSKLSLTPPPVPEIRRSTYASRISIGDDARYEKLKTQESSLPRTPIESRRQSVNDYQREFTRLSVDDRSREIARSQEISLPRTSVESRRLSVDDYEREFTRLSVDDRSREIARSQEISLPRTPVESRRLSVDDYERDTPRPSADDYTREIIRSRESSVARTPFESRRASVDGYQEDISRGDSRYSAKQDELIFGTPTTDQRTSHPKYQVEVNTPSRRATYIPTAAAYEDITPRPTFKHPEMVTECTLLLPQHILEAGAYCHAEPYQTDSSMNDEINIENYDYRKMSSPMDIKSAFRLSQESVIFQASARKTLEQSSPLEDDECKITEQWNRELEDRIALQNSKLSEIVRQDTRRISSQRPSTQSEPLERSSRGGQNGNVKNESETGDRCFSVGEIQKRSETCLSILKADCEEWRRSAIGHTPMMDSAIFRKSSQSLEQKPSERSSIRRLSGRISDEAPEILRDSQIEDAEDEPASPVVADDELVPQMTPTASKRSTRSYRSSCNEEQSEVIVQRSTLGGDERNEIQILPECGDRHTIVITSSKNSIASNKSCDTSYIVQIKHQHSSAENIEATPGTPQRLSSTVEEHAEEALPSSRHSTVTLQDKDKVSRRSSSAVRSPTKSDQRHGSSRQVSQDDGIRRQSSNEMSKSRRSSDSRRHSSRLDTLPREHGSGSRKSSSLSYEHAMNNVTKTDSEVSHEDDQASLASQETSTWKQTGSEGGAEATGKQRKSISLFPHERRSVDEDLCSEKSNTHTLDDPPSIATYDSEKQHTELSVLEKDPCGDTTNAETTEDEMTASVRSKGSKRFSQIFRKKSGGDEYESNKENSDAEVRRSLQKQVGKDDRFLQVQVKKDNDDTDNFSSSSDEGTYKSDSRLDYDSGANVAAGDMCPQGQISKIRGRITFRSFEDVKTPTSRRSTTVAIQNGAVKMITSPKGVNIVNYDTEGTHCSDLSDCTDRTRGPKHRRSNSLAATNDSMARYIRDSKYIRERQMRLLEYEQNHTQSCDPGSYMSLIGGHRSPVPAPRGGRRGGFACDNFRDETSESTEYDEDISFREINRRALRSRSNSARYEYQSERYRAKIIDSFRQVITPEQPSAVHDQRQTRSRCDYITQTLPHSPLKKQCGPTLNKPSRELSKIERGESRAANKPTGKSNALYSDYNRNRNSPMTKNAATSHTRENPFLLVRNEFIPCEDHDSIKENSKRLSGPNRFSIQSQQSPSYDSSFEADNEKSGMSISKAEDIVHRRVRNQGRFIPENESTEFTDSSPDSSTLLTIAKNKNCSSNTERDRNSSSGCGDFLYSDFAYHCGVIDTLRLLDFDNVSSTASTKLSLADVVEEVSDLPRKMSHSHTMNDENMTELARNLPSLGVDNQDDEAIELVRQNSIRALLFAASMSNSWTPFRIFPNESCKDTAKWVQQLKERVTDAVKSPVECQSEVSDSSTKQIREDYSKAVEKRSDETLDNTLTFDLEVKNCTDESKPPANTAKVCSSKSIPLEENFYEKPAKKVIHKTRKNISPARSISGDMAADSKKKSTVMSVDCGANTDVQTLSKKNTKSTTRGVKIQVDCTRNAAIQTVNNKDTVEKCDKSENTELEYFVRDCMLEAKISNQSHKDMSKGSDVRHNYSAPDSKELHSSKSYKRSTRAYRFFHAMRSDSGLSDVYKLIAEHPKPKPKSCTAERIKRSEMSPHKSYPRAPRKRSLSLESINQNIESPSPDLKRRKKPHSHSTERDVKEQSHHEEDPIHERVKSYLSNRSNKYEAINGSSSSVRLLSEECSPEIDFKSYPGRMRHASRKHSWYEDYKPPNTNKSQEIMETNGIVEKNTFGFERSKSVCSCQRCQRRRRDLQRYISARRTGNDGRKEVIVCKSRRYLGACGDVSTNNKTENNCKSCLGDDRPLLDNITIFVVASQTSLAGDEEDKCIYPATKNSPFKRKLIKRALEKASSVCSNGLDKVHIFTIADTVEHRQVSESPTIEDLGQFTSWKNESNVPMRHSKAKNMNAKETSIDDYSENSLTETEEEFDANDHEEDAVLVEQRTRLTSRTKKKTIVPRPDNDNTSPRRLRDKSACVARDNKSNSSKWDSLLDTNESKGNHGVTFGKTSRSNSQSKEQTVFRNVKEVNVYKGQNISRNQASEDESVESDSIKAANDCTVDSVQNTSTSKWKDTYLDATDFQTSAGVFNSSRASRSATLDEQESQDESQRRDKQRSDTGHNSRRSAFELTGKRPRPLHGEALESNVDHPVNQTVDNSAPLRFIQSIIDGQVKLLLDKAIQNWTSPMLRKPSLFNSMDTGEKTNAAAVVVNKISRLQKFHDDVDSPDLSLSPLEPAEKSQTKLEVNATNVQKELSPVMFMAASNQQKGNDNKKSIKSRSRSKEASAALTRQKTRNSTGSDREVETKSGTFHSESILTRSYSTNMTRIFSSSDITNSYMSASDTDVIPLMRDQNSSKLGSYKRSAQGEPLVRSSKSSRSRRTSSKSSKRRRKPETHTEQAKSDSRSSKSPVRSTESKTRKSKSPPAETSSKRSMSTPKSNQTKPSPSLKRKDVKSKKRAYDKKEKQGETTASGVANAGQVIPKEKSFSECGLSRIASKLTTQPKIEVLSQGVTSSSTEDIKQKIIAGCKHFSQNAMERRMLEELMEQKLCALQRNEEPHFDVDTDSLAGCDAIESCLLTPITEESQSTHERHKNDFNSFVSECKEKLKDIISKSKGSGNITLPNVSNKTVHSSNTSKSIENNTESKEETDKSFDLKSSSAKTTSAHSSSHSDQKDSDNVYRGKRDSSGAPMQLKGPYKSAFLRSEMNHTNLEMPDGDSFLKENQLISQYSVKKSYTRQNSSRDWMGEKMHEDLNFSKSKYVDHQDSFRNFTANLSTYPSTINYRFSMTESHYKSSYLRNAPRNYSDVYTATQHYGRHHSVFGSATADYCVERAQWFLNDTPSGNRAYSDLAKRNRNESANNGSESSSSESSGVDDVLNIVEGEKYPSGANRGNVYFSSDKSISDRHIKDMKTNKDVKQRPRKASYEGGTCCQFHESNSNSYDVFKTNVPAGLVSTLASRNINGSGNMFGRSNCPTDENRGGTYISMGGEQLGDSDEDYTSASEDILNYNSLKIRNKFIRNDSQEMDDTCNHPDAIGYYATNGQSSQLDVFNGAPKEDMLVNMFSADDSHPVVISSYRQKPDMNDRAGNEKKQGCSERDTQAGNGHGQPMYKENFSGSRSCFGQGDTSSKKGFTQWYVDDVEKNNQSQRRAPVATENSKYGHRDDWAEESKKNVGHEERCEDDGDIEDDEDDDRGDEYDDEDAAKEEDEEEDDDVEEEEDDDDAEEDEDGESDDSNLDRELTHVIGDAPNGDCRKKEVSGEIGDTRHYKGEPKNVPDSLENRAAQNKSYNQSKYKCFDSKTGRMNIKHHRHGHRYSSGSRIKHSGTGYQKFSLDQIKVPTIEKDRVRFACDENGDWAEIGRGSYGCVYLGLLDGIVEVAIKDFYESSSWDLVIHEARMLMFLQDTGITPKFYGLRRRFDVSKQPSEYCIIMEYFGDGRTLFNVMSDKIALTRDAWLDIVGQLVAGLRLIHRKNILINDLKADNILIDLTG